MKVQGPYAASVPKSLATDLLAANKVNDDCPGFIVSTKPLLEHNQVLAESVNGMLGRGYPKQFPALLATPAATSSIFKNSRDSSIFNHSEELSILKSVFSLIAEQVHPHLKHGVDVIWLVYGAAQLHDEWSRPEADHGVCAIKLAGLGLSAVNFAGALKPNIAMPDSWSNGIDYVLKSGEALYQGKTLNVNDLMASSDKRLEIPLKLLKLAGASLDRELRAGTPEFGVNTGISILSQNRPHR
jgi:hypothetical protein